MAELVNDIGLKLKSNAVCVHTHRVRHGYFTLDDTLLHKDWNIRNIAGNMDNCEQHLTPEKLFINLAVKGSTGSIEESVESDFDEEGNSLIPHQLPSAMQLASKYSKYKSMNKDGAATKLEINR